MAISPLHDHDDIIFIELFLVTKTGCHLIIDVWKIMWTEKRLTEQFKLYVKRERERQAEEFANEEKERRERAEKQTKIFAQNISWYFLNLSNNIWRLLGNTGFSLPQDACHVQLITRRLKLYQLTFVWLWCIYSLCEQCVILNTRIKLLFLCVIFITDNTRTRIYRSFL